MKKLIIVGAGDFGREVSWLVERLNKVAPEWDLLGYVDDNPAVQGQKIDGYPVLGTTEYLKELDGEVYVVCSIGTGRIRKLVMERVLQQPNLRAATLVDPAAIVGRDMQIGEGCVICAGTILTVSAVLGDHVILNLNCTVGHDAIVRDFCTVNPGSNLSGRVLVGECTDIGTGTKIIQGKTICPGCVLGAGSVVIRDLTEAGTYVGVPAQKVK